MEDLPTQEIEKQDPEKALKELNEVLKKDEEIKIEVPKYVPEEKSEEKKFSEFLTKSKPEDIYRSFKDGKYSYEDIMEGKVKADPSVLKYFSKEDWMKVHGVETKLEDLDKEKELREKQKEGKLLTSEEIGILKSVEVMREMNLREKEERETEEKIKSEIKLEKTIDNALDKAREVLGKENSITEEADKLLNSLKDGSIPAFISENIKKIAKENNIDITPKTAPEDIINELKNKKNKTIKLEPKIVELPEEEKKKGYEIVPDTKEMTLDEVVKIAESLDKGNKKNLPDQKEVENAMDKLPEETKKKIGIGLDTIGFLVEEKKNNFFAKTFELASKGFNKKGTMGRFLASLEENYTRDAGKTRQRMEEMKEGKMKQLSNVGYLAGNVLKYGRTVADAVGYTFASPLRYVMMGGMMFSRGSEAAKEARLKNEKVIEKTRIKDIDQMADEAWKIYENAQKKAGEGEVKKEDLDKAYNENIPKDLMERLKKDPEPGVASGIIERIIKKDVGRSIKNIDKKLEKIEADKKLSAQEKEIEKEKIIKKYSEHLNSLDRMVSQYGTVDNLAMAAKYMETGSKALVKVMMVETLVLSIDKLFSSASEIFTHHGENMVVPQAGVLHEVVHQPPPIEGAVENTMEVKSGDSVWKIVDRQLEGRGYFKEMAGSPEEIMAKKTYIIDAIKDEIVKDPKSFGITSGDADKIMAGEKINLSSFFEKNTSNVKLSSIIEKAQGIGKEDIASILSHKEAPEISHYELLELEKVGELKLKVDINHEPKLEYSGSKLVDNWDKSIFGSETVQPEIEPVHPETPVEIHKPEIQDIPLLNVEQAKESLNIQNFISSENKEDWEKIKNMTYDEMSKKMPKFETRLNSVVAGNASKLGFDAGIKDGEKIGDYVERIVHSTVK